MKDPASADLNAEELHLLGCVDGTLGEDELAFVAGRGMDEVATMLDRLAEIGLVRFGATTSDQVPDSDAAPESGDGIQLSADDRARVDEHVGLLKTADHYHLLDIPRDATRDEIKKAYYRLAPKFHPDRYYGKNLGDYKGKIERVFATLTKAHDTLCYPKRRKSYDATLPPLKPGDRIRRRREEDRASDPGRVADPGPPPRAPSPSMRPGQPRSPAPPPGDPFSDPQRYSPPPARPSSPDGRSSPSPRPSSPSPRPSSPSLRPSSPSLRPSSPGRPSSPERPSPPGPRSSSPGPRSSEPAPSAPARPSAAPRQRRISKAERDALARKLGRRGGSVPPRAPARPITEVRQRQRDVEEVQQPKTVRKSAAELLRGRYDKVRDTAKRRRLAKYLETARVAMEAGDYRAAAAAFEQASRISPEDPDIRKKATSAAEMALGQSER